MGEPLAAPLGERGVRHLQRLALPRELALLRDNGAADDHRLRRVRLVGRRRGPAAVPRPEPLGRLEVYRVGGANAIRRILARLRADAPFTTGRLFVHHVNHVLGRDLRPLARRRGFDDGEHAAQGDAPPHPPPAAIAATRPALSPSRPRPGGRLTASTVATRADWGARLDSAAVVCTARATGRALAAVSRAFVGGVARCTWKVPRWARGAVVSGTITVVDRGGATTRVGFSARVRRA